MTIRRKGSDIPDGNPDETYVFSRAADRSFLMKLSVTMDKYKPLMWMAGILFIAVGFGFKTPSQTFGAIHQRLDSLEAHQRLLQSEMTVDKQNLELKIDALIKIQCFDVVNKKLEREAQLAGLTCTTFLGR